MKHILVIDDEAASRDALREMLSGEHEVSVAESAGPAADLLSDRRVDLILLDTLMTQRDGLSFLREVQNRYPDVPVVMVSAATSAGPVVEALREGAYDFLSKPFEPAEVRRTLTRALESSSLQRHVTILQNEVSREFPVDGIVGQSVAFKKALHDARKASLTDSSVLLCGESGTGKELVARYIHATGPRREEPFVPVHCAALPDSLMESELFGHEKGAFTHAESRKPGRFDLAASGTLFFDEVSEMSSATQVKLLRVLQRREFMRVGGTQVIRTNARIIAASAKDLHAEVQNGAFLEDLHDRLRSIPILLPPLRERPEDIPLLARYFLTYYAERIGVATRDFESETMDRLCRYPWPGNIRELRNLAERLLVLHGHFQRIRPEFLPDEFQFNGNGAQTNQQRPKLAEAVSRYERMLIEEALHEANGVQTQAARLLGTTRRILKYRMEKLKIANHRGRRSS